MALLGASGAGAQSGVAVWDGSYEGQIVYGSETDKLTWTVKDGTIDGDANGAHHGSVDAAGNASGTGDGGNGVVCNWTAKFTLSGSDVSISGDDTCPYPENTITGKITAHRTSAPPPPPPAPPPPTTPAVQQPPEDPTLPPCGSRTQNTGPGYSGLTDDMKYHLGTLYAVLDAKQACHRFNSGLRTRAGQRDLFKRWHDIADKRGDSDHRSLKEVCAQLKAAGFDQCPTKNSKGRWRNSTGTAFGEPGKPGRSRHEVGQAADLRVIYKVGKDQKSCPEGGAPILQRCTNWTQLRRDAAGVGLCGPKSTDKVHVELKYMRDPRREVRPHCHFG